MSIATTRPSAARLRGAGDDERADAAGPDHRDRVVRPLPDAREGVERDGQRLRHRGGVVVAGLGDARQIAAGEVTYSARPPSTCRPSVR